MEFLKSSRRLVRGALDYRANRISSKRWEYFRGRLLDLAAVNNLLSEVVTSNRRFMVGRPGGTEGRIVEEFVRSRWGRGSPWKVTPYSPWARWRGPEWSGIVGDGAKDFDVFSMVYLRAILASDALFISTVAPSIFPWARLLSETGVPVADLAYLNPYRALKAGITPWTKALEGKKVLIVHPFEDSIRTQFSRRKDITGVKEILPDFQLDVLRPPVTFAGENQTATWFEQFEKVSSELREKDFDVMIAGAGGYGLPLAQIAQDMGKTGIHYGGQVQTLFGIRGKRFGHTSSIAAVMDATWISPSAAETPKHADRVEGGAYW